MMANDFIKKRFDPTQRYGLRLTLLVIAVLLVAIPFGMLLREVTQQGPMTRVDTSAARTLHEYVRDSPALVNFLQVISFVGSPIWFYIVTGFGAIWMWRQG